MPAPIPGSPRARRVVSRQPLAARAFAACQAPVSELPATLSTSAAATTSGRWLIEATAASWAAADMRTDLAPTAVASASTRAASSGVADAVGTITHGRPTNRSAVAAATPVASLPASG